MKKLKTISLSVLKPAAGLLAIALLITSCSKDDDNFTPSNPAALALVHAAPGAPQLALKINNANSNLKAFTFGSFINYNTINEGNYSLSVTKKDSTRTLASISSTFKSSKHYSLFVADVLGKTALTVIEDDLTAPAADKANLRFVNMSPDAGVLDLAITGQTAPVTTKTAFKAATAFTAITPGAEINLEIRENAKATVLAKIEKVKIEKGKTYTIWAKGLKAATDSTKLAVAVITNK